MERRINIVSVKQVKRDSARARTRLASDLGAAIAQQDITVHYQPQFNLRSGRACGVEALARWVHRGHSMPPSTFIPIAEHYGLIDAIGVSVLRQACATFSSWQAASDLTLSVNLSPRQINEGFADLVLDMVSKALLPPSCLELEITETAVMANPGQAVRTLERCRANGVRIALDDFGTGYSSLNYLAQLPIDRLKLDKSFVHRMPVDHKTTAIIRSVLAMGRDLGLAVIAEGIETEQQLAMLDAMGCIQGQGNLLSTPMPADAALQVLQRPWGDRFAAVASHTEDGDLHAA